MYHTLWDQVRTYYDQIHMIPAQETAVSLFVCSLVGGGITRTFRPWTHTSDDSYINQLSLVVATATVSLKRHGKTHSVSMQTASKVHESLMRTHEKSALNDMAFPHKSPMKLNLRTNVPWQYQTKDARNPANARHCCVYVRGIRHSSVPSNT